MLIFKYQVPSLRQKEDVSISLSKDLLRFIARAFVKKVHCGLKWAKTDL